MSANQSHSTLEFNSFGSQQNLLDEQLSTSTGHGGADLSFSELEISRPGGEPTTPAAPRTRDEKLQSDLFKLRKLNDALSAYNDALAGAQTSTQLVSRRVEQTDRLLNNYIDILWQTEQTARLIFDPEWRGGEDDELALERERLAQELRERKEREERERAAREEAERLERERLEQERIQAEKERQAKRGPPPVRGMRGIRARGSAPVATRGASTATARGRLAPPRGTYASRGGRGS
ncbi:hypothetical protein AURDEDRAFT_181308 [Auricularia subglabra TFB-10046 SS5]|nr:hypothetical protein AURDEDRAFT_181308 [Auricularia subglabra TFB-10046 SS5]